ncbi:hypothetical protein QTP88_018320 [Uroleucon formosanum]
MLGQLNVCEDVQDERPTLTSSCYIESEENKDTENNVGDMTDVDNELDLKSDYPTDCGKFHETQAVISAIKKVSTIRMFVKNILPYKSLRNVKDKIGKPLYLTEKILYAHLKDPVKQDIIERNVSFIKLTPDRAAMQNTTAQLATPEFISSVLKRVDNLIETKTVGVENLKRANSNNEEVFSHLKTASAKYGVGFWHLGSGIIHQIISEIYAFPGLLMVGTHSHTLNDGGLDDLCIGVNGADAVEATANFPRESKCPKNAILKVADSLTVKGGTGAVIEYHGTGVDNTSCTGNNHFLYTIHFLKYFEFFDLFTDIFKPLRGAPLCASAVCTAQTKSSVTGPNESIIVPGFPKPNGLPQPNPFDGPERDLVNFPRMVRLENPVKTRYLFVPEKWFEMFYKKTGVTGPYVLAAGVLNYLLSKEIWVVDHDFPYVFATMGVFYVGWKKFGTLLADLIDKEIDEYEKSCYADRTMEIFGLRETIKHQKTEIWRTGAQKHLIQSKRENVAIQLETIHRERTLQAYNQVKRRLDYHVDLANLTRTVQHRIMIKWVVDNVLMSMTIEQEKKTINKCILDLKELAAK